jgi:uncharacterized protein (TIGR02145 family)
MKHKHISILALAAALCFFSCTEVERDNPFDEKGILYGKVCVLHDGDGGFYWYGTTCMNVSKEECSEYGGKFMKCPFEVDDGNSSSSSSSLEKPDIVYGPTINDEGEIYPTVVIGTQTWMAKNLNYAAKDSKCYDNDPDNCERYGRLYGWLMAMNCTDYRCNVQTKHQGICPDGWHIPSEAEWYKLLRYVDGVFSGLGEYKSETAGKYLKATSGWESGGNGEDWYGFAALPGGTATVIRGSGGNTFNFGGVGDYGSWWSSKNDCIPGMSYLKSEIYYQYLATGSDGGLQSVRCVKD